MTDLVESLATEIQKLNPSARIELFELDATALGGDVLRFHAGTNQLRQDVVWQGDTYSRFPIEATGFEFTGQGQFPRPKIRVSNILSAITTLLIANNDLMGAKLTRKRTCAKFLDAVNFTGGVNPDADPTAEFADDIYYVDRKSHEDKNTVEFELATSLDQVGINLPRRQIIQNVCIWKYRGAECGYTGPPIYDVNDDRITSNGTSTEGGDLLTKHRSWTDSEDTLTLRNRDLSLAAQARDSACTIRLLETQYFYGAIGGLTAPGDYVVFQDYNTGVLTAYWNGVVVSVGTTYRKGSQKLSFTAFNGVSAIAFEIERWGADSSVCTPASTTYTSALSARDSAKTDRDSKLSDYNTAASVLPNDDGLYVIERCGKRLSSCKLRFGANNPLPFGSFPAVGLTK